MWSLLFTLVMSKQTVAAYSLVQTSSFKLYLRPTFQELSFDAIHFLEEAMRKVIMNTANELLTSNALVNVDIVLQEITLYNRRLVTLQQLDLPTTIVTFSVLGTWEQLATSPEFDTLVGHSFSRSTSRLEFRTSLRDSILVELQNVVDIIVTKVANRTDEGKLLPTTIPPSPVPTMDISLIVISAVILIIALIAVALSRRSVKVQADQQRDSSPAVVQQERAQFTTNSGESTTTTMDLESLASHSMHCPIERNHSVESLSKEDRVERSPFPDKAIAMMRKETTRAKVARLPDGHGSTSKKDDHNHFGHVSPPVKTDGFLKVAIGDWFRTIRAIGSNASDDESNRPAGKASSKASNVSKESSSGWSTGNSNSINSVDFDEMFEDDDSSSVQAILSSTVSFICSSSIHEDGTENYEVSSSRWTQVKSKSGDHVDHVCDELVSKDNMCSTFTEVRHVPGDLSLGNIVREGLIVDPQRY